MKGPPQNTKFCSGPLFYDPEREKRGEGGEKSQGVLQSILQRALLMLWHTGIFGVLFCARLS